MATIKTLLGNVKGKDGGGYEEVILYDGDCSACLNSNIITSSSAMIELSDSIENYKSIRIEYITYDGRGKGEGLICNLPIVMSVDYIKTTYGYNAFSTGIPKDNASSNFAFGFYNDKHLAQTWASHGSLPHNMSHITVTGIRDRVSDAEKNFNKYSTTEEVVGTWIDGKPIYRKVVKLSVVKKNAKLISNVDNLINTRGSFQWNGSLNYKYAFPCNNDDVLLYAGILDNNIILDTNYTNNSLINFCAFFEYTKTTD